jgi:hypothetical protein
MNKKIERIITIGLAVGLVAYFCYQLAYGAKESSPGLIDGNKCPIMDNTSYQYGTNEGLIAFYPLDDSCDSTAPSHTDQCIKGYTDAYNGATK